MNQSADTTRAPCALARLTFQETERELKRLPALILPLAGCEPYGRHGTLGVTAACAQALADELSRRLDMLQAPLMAYGCSTPYGAFGGASGIKPRTLTNLLCETVRRWQTQGFRTFIIIDALYDNREAVDLALRRLTSGGKDMAAVCFSLQRDDRIRAFIGRRLPTAEPGRTEFGLLSLAAFIDPDLVRSPAVDGSGDQRTDEAAFKKWRKRGADPEQFRKLFPACSASERAGGDPAFGRELFGYALQLLEEAARAAAGIDRRP